MQVKILPDANSFLVTGFSLIKEIYSIICNMTISTLNLIYVCTVNSSADSFSPPLTFQRMFRLRQTFSDISLNQHLYNLKP